MLGARGCHLRRRYVVYGTDAVVHYDTHVNCGHNLLASITERIFSVSSGGVVQRPPQPRRTFEYLTASFRELICGEIRPATPATLDQIVAMYKGRRRTAYQKARLDLAITPAEPRDAKIDLFVKAEPINLTDKVRPVPRAIQPRSKRYNLEVARFIKPVEHKLYAAAALVPWDRPTLTPVIFKGLNVFERGKALHEKWLSFKRPAAIMMDASRFDQHVSVPALQWEHSVYVMLYALHHDCDRLRELLSWQLVNKGKARCRETNTEIEYTVKGCRMSGDMNTALGNCLIMTGLCFGLTRATGIQVEVCNDGDDCVLICEQGDVDRLLAAIPTFFRDAGFTLVVEEVVTVLEHIEFCQCHPVFNGQQYIMVRNVQKALSNDAAGFGKWADPRMYGPMMSTVGLGGGHLSTGIPVMQSFYEAMRTQGAKFGGLPRKWKTTPPDDILESGFGRMMRDAQRHTKRAMLHDPLVEPISVDARLSFELAFGITPHTQMVLERGWSFNTPDMPEREVPPDLSSTWIRTSPRSYLIRPN